MRKSNRGIRFDLLLSLIHPACPETVAGSQATLTPGVSRPVHDKGTPARLSGEAGNKRRCEKAGFEPSRARAERDGSRTDAPIRVLTGSDLSGTALAEKNSFYPGGSSTERRTRD